MAIGKVSPTLYAIRKNCALWQVIMCMSGIIVYTSMSRKRCLDFIAENEPKDTIENNV